MTLYERKNEYNQKKLSLCQNGCEFEGYNSTTKKVKCKCEMQSKIDLSLLLDSTNHKDELVHKFIDIKKTANLGVIKCYKLLFSKKGLISNIGSYILFAILLFFFILSIIFYNKGFKKIKNKIYEIVKLKKGQKLNINSNINIKNNKIKKDNINKIETEVNDKKAQILNINFSQKKKTHRKKNEIKRKSSPYLNFSNSKEGIVSDSIKKK